MLPAIQSTPTCVKAAIGTTPLPQVKSPYKKTTDSITLAKAKESSCCSWLINVLKKLRDALVHCISFQWLFKPKQSPQVEVDIPAAPITEPKTAPEAPKETKPLPPPLPLVRKYSDRALQSQKNAEVFCKRSFDGWVENQDDPVLKKELLAMLKDTSTPTRLFKDWEKLRLQKTQETDAFDKSGFSTFVNDEQFLEKLKKDPAFIGSRIYLLQNGGSQDVWQRCQKKHKLAIAIVEKFYMTYLSKFQGVLVSQRVLQTKLKDNVLSNSKAKALLLADWRRRFPADLSTDDKLANKLHDYILQTIVKAFIKERLSGGMPLSTMQILNGKKSAKSFSIKDFPGAKHKT